jgi:hypothetical protein
MKAWKLAVATAVAVGLGVLVAFLVGSSGGHEPSATDSVKRAGRATPDTKNAAQRSTATTDGAAATSGARIEMSSPSYFGRPFETIQLAGRYLGVHTPRTLRVQVRQPTGWKQFPLPTVTQPSGTFRAYVELGRGRYRVRLVDPDKDRASAAVTLLVF